MRNAVGFLAGLDFLDFEVTAVGDDADGFDPEDVAGRLGGLRQWAMSTTWLVSACSTIILVFASTAPCERRLSYTPPPSRGCRDRSARSGPRRSGQAELASLRNGRASCARL